MAKDRGHPADGEDVDDAFDRRVGEILEHDAALLREQTELLITTGSLSVKRPAGVLTGHLRPPTWWRRGELLLHTATADGSGSGRIPLSRAEYHDQSALRSEIKLQIAVQPAALEQ